MVQVVGPLLPSIRGVEKLHSLLLATVKSESFPNSLAPLRAADAIVFVEPFRMELAAQEKALLRWVSSGGRLVFSPGRGPAHLPAGLWRDLCPIDILGTEELTLPSGSDLITVPLAVGRARPGAEPCYTMGGRPAAYRWSKGRGQVVFAAFPLDLASAEQIAPPAAFWRSVLEIPPKKEELPGLRQEELQLFFTGTEAVARAITPRGEYTDLLSLG